MMALWAPGVGSWCGLGLGYHRPNQEPILRFSVRHLRAHREFSNTLSVADLTGWLRNCGFHCAGRSVPDHVCDRWQNRSRCVGGDAGQATGGLAEGKSHGPVGIRAGIGGRGAGLIRVALSRFSCT
ncbi:hypothetical protein FXW78_19180 [Rhodococcus opacus]|nr:hypothetical protein [Rhodococcus opacus]